MKRWLAIVLFGLVGLVSLAVAFLIPAYGRALDSQVVVAAGLGSSSLVDAGLNFIKVGKIGPARLLAQVATNFPEPSTERLVASLDRIPVSSQHVWGRPAPDLDLIFSGDSRLELNGSRPILSWLLSASSRAKVMAYLSASQRFGVREILRTRSLTNLVQFAPAPSPTGQPLDAITLLAGLLLQGDDLSRPLKQALETAAAVALRRGEVAPLESSYLALLTLAHRLDWGQLTEVLQHVSMLETLPKLAEIVRSDAAQFPTVYSVLVAADRPVALFSYLSRFKHSAGTDLRFSLGCGTGATQFILAQQKRIYYAHWREPIVAWEPLAVLFRHVISFALLHPVLAVTIKYLLVVIGAFFWALLTAALFPRVWGLRGRWWSANQVVFIGCVLIVMLAVSEPFLAPGGPGVARHGTQLAQERGLSSWGIRNLMLDLFTLVAIVTFLIVQGILYALAMSKLAEIQRQPVSSQLKLKLLENEENLFDAGLYAGLAGTAGSLVLLAMGFVSQSLTPAYASTLFGIIFVMVLKIGHLRPYRRSLILTSETGTR